MSQTKETIEKTAQELLAQLDLEEPKISLEEDEEGHFHLGIETEDSRLLIGYHGQNIYAFQLILSLLVYKKLGQWQRIVVDVGNWRKKREEQLRRMAYNAAQKVKFSGQPVAMPYLNAAERRIIHLALSENPEVTTHSEGQGRERRLIIEPKEI